MAKDPAVLFYTSDFISGTELLSYEQKGQYIHLLCTQHQSGHLPEEYMLKVLGGKNNIVWNKFIQDEETLWFNVRMDEEKEKRNNYVESRRKIGEMGGRPSKNNHKVNHKVKHMGNHMENENDNVNVIKDNKYNKVKHQDCVYLTTEEYQKLVDKFGVLGTKERIEELNTGVMSKGYKYKSHYHTILMWDKNRKIKEFGKDAPKKVERPEVLSKMEQWEREQSENEVAA